jgi:cytochrome b
MSAEIVWPWWVRLSHWLVAIGVTAIWILTYMFYETDELHRWIGYAIVLAVSVRIFLAHFTPSQAAKLSLPSKRALMLHIAHLKQLDLPVVSGHNPLGQWAVYAIWTMIGLLALTGWLSRTDMFWGEDLPVDIHAWLSGILMGTVLLHVLAVLVVGRIARQRLILQMLHGKLHVFKK